MKQPKSVHDHVKIHMVLFWFGVAIVVVGGIFSEPLQPHWLLWVGVAVFLSSSVYRLLIVRCPHCGSSLLSCHVLPEYCPDCGKELE